MRRADFRTEADSERRLLFYLKPLRYGLGRLLLREFYCEDSVLVLRSDSLSVNVGDVEAPLV